MGPTLKYESSGLSVNSLTLKIEVKAINESDYYVTSINNGKLIVEILNICSFMSLVKSLIRLFQS